MAIMIRGVVPMWYDVAPITGATEGGGCVGEESGGRWAIPLPLASIILQSGAILEARGMARLRGGCNDVFHHRPSPGIVKSRLLLCS